MPYKSTLTAAITIPPSARPPLSSLTIWAISIDIVTKVIDLTSIFALTRAQLVTVPTT